MSNITFKLDKKIENLIRERTFSLLLTEKMDLEEVSINWLEKLRGIGPAFTKEKESDKKTGNEPTTSGEQIKYVNIPLPYPEEKKAEVLKDPEVQKLLQAFYAKWDIGDSASKKHFEKSIALSPDTMVKRYLGLAGVDNKATPGDDSVNSPQPDDPASPTGGSEGESGPKPVPNRIKKALEVLDTRMFDEKVSELIDDIFNDYARKEFPNADKDFLYNMKSSIEQIKKQIIDPLQSDATSGNVNTYGFKNESIYKALLKEQLAITNLSETDMAELVNEINKFYPYAKEYLGFDNPVELTLISDPDNAKDTFGKTAYYNPANEQMTIFVDGRHPKDIIRSFSHELVHHAQNCRGEFDRDFNVGENYIETDDHLREMEREAYDKGNMCLRTYESYLKKENKTMNEETLRKSIREAIKRVVENKTETIDEAGANPISGKSKKKDGRNVWDQLTDKPAPKEDDGKRGAVSVVEDSGEDEAWHQWKNEHADDDHIKEIEHHLKALRDDRDYEEHGAEHDHDKYEDEGMEEDQNRAGHTEDPEGKFKTSYGHMKEETIEETGAEKTGASKGDKGKDKEDPKDRDYSGHGERKGDESDTHPGEKDDTTKKDDELKHSGKGRGEKKGDKAYVNEEETTTSLHESMAVKKGQLVFDKLVKKWCK